MDTLFKVSSGFHSLSLRDLVEARDHAHAQLLSKKNVVATAVGLYRIRKSDPWPTEKNPRERRVRSRTQKEPRTLFNSEVRPYSWPCIYVFVADWCEEEKLSEKDPSDVVPSSIFMPDNRVIPVCVIEARLQPVARDLAVRIEDLRPRNFFGPGSAIINEDAQGMRRLATAGCIARDGDRYYVLTNRHAVGKAGTAIEAMKPHRSERIGVTAEIGSTREDFHEVYPHFVVTNGQRLMTDVGLIDVDDITRWKTEVPRIHPVGPVLDLYDNSFSLQLIAQRVVGYSAVSGLVRGEIQGLFYRYKEMGGKEYVSDFLIGPRSLCEDVGETKEVGRDEAFHVHHGDSGTLLFIEHRYDGEKTYYPFGLLWGKEEFIQDREFQTRPFALATALSTALDRLNLDLVTDINRDQEYVWGWVGHYAIGEALTKALGSLKSPQLLSFVTRNAQFLAVSPDDRLGNDPRVIENGDTQHPRFVALADVPDNVWKGNVNFYTVKGTDGKSQRKAGPGSRGQADNPNHFADLDLPYKGFDTFLAFNLKDLKNNLTVAHWLDYFNTVKPRYDAWGKALGKTSPPYSHWGALPFRVWQLFAAMTAAAKAGQQDKFLCASGVLIHYVGDACQPLHTSYLSQGDPDRVVKRPKSDGYKLEADGVHSGYEDDMVNYGYLKKDLQKNLLTAIASQDKSAKEKIAAISSGFEAAAAIIQLVAMTHETIKPCDIVDKWVALKGASKSDRDEAMWDDFGDRTIECMARGTRYLARIVSGAWTAGDGKGEIGAGTVSTQAKLMKLYNSDFVPSIRLDEYPSIGVG